MSNYDKPQLAWLGKKDELEFRNLNFSGKWAGLGWKYYQSVETLLRTRAIILAMVLLVFYPVIAMYLLMDQFNAPLLWERTLYAGLFLLAGLIFNRARTIAFVLAFLPAFLYLLVITVIYPHFFTPAGAGYWGAFIFLLGYGYYHHVRAASLRKKLHGYFLENHLNYPSGTSAP